MTYERTLHCTQCGRPGQGARCGSCGSSRVMTPREHAGHVAFILNELDLPPLSTAMEPAARTGVLAHYRTELWRALTPDEPVRAPEPVAAQPLAAPAALPPAPPAPPPPFKREPFDWNWLAEQQANLLLFAGAFLTVVAALIYVGYSEQAVSGALKMTLLAGYTLAFLAAGTVCLRYPRVDAAGRVFFGIGALLVPINFVAAREIFTESDLSAESMWLAASIVTAGFYAAVAWLGMGRLYAIGAGLALVSGTAAAVTVSATPIEWAALPFILTGFVMVMTDVDGDDWLRVRLGTSWTWIGQATATLAASFAVLIALVEHAPEDSIDPRTLWFLPVTLAAFAAAAAVPMAISKRPQFGIATAVGAAGAGVSIAYALRLPAEGWVLTSALVAAMIGATLPLVQAYARRLPQAAEEGIVALGMAVLAFAGMIAFWAVQMHVEEQRELTSRWFLAPSFGLAFVFAGFVASLPRARGTWGVPASIGLAGTVFGSGLAVMFGLAWPAEAYSAGIAAMAVVLILAASMARRGDIKRVVPADLEDVCAYGAVAAAGFAGFMAAWLMLDGRDSATRWLAPAAFAMAAATFAIFAAARHERGGALGLAASIGATSIGLVYALEVSAEYYAFALLAPAFACMACLRFAPRSIDDLLEPTWRDDVTVLARAGALGGVLVAAIAAAVSGDEMLTNFEAQTRVFLPLAMLFAAATAGLDASRGRRFEVSAAFALAMMLIAFAMPYAFDAGAAWYGASLVVAGVALALAGQFTRVSWFDGEARDFMALLAVSLSTLPFERAYADVPQLGAAVHIAAAAFFAAAALLRTGARTFADVTDIRALSAVPLSGGWLYPAGLCATVGYIFSLRAIDAGGQEGGTLAVTFLTVTLAFAASAAAMRYWRPALRVHLYVLAICAAVASLATSADPGTVAALLTVYVALFAGLSALERSPLLAAPGVVFAFLAVPAWQQSLEASTSMIPVTYAAIGLCLYGAALALRDSTLTRGLRAAGASFAIVAPAAGFGMLYAQDDASYTTTALYQWSTIAVALVGMMALVESIVSGRRWIIVPASAVLTIALLLQVSTLQPANIQAYTAIIGSYLVLLAVAGLSRARLLPQWAPYAVYIEALGAATIMLPSFAQSFGEDWRYQWILAVEATIFLVAAVTLRRKGLLAAAVLFLVLTGGRVLFDAVNALPNWMVVAVCGVALLGAGMGILLGRERWDAWQRTIVGWWDEATNGALQGR